MSMSKVLWILVGWFVIALVFGLLFGVIAWTGKER